MMITVCPFAMTVYSHWYDRWLEPALWPILLGISAVVVFGWGLLHSIPLRGPYFSGLFVLALCPYFCFSLAGLIRTQEWRFLANADEKLGEALVQRLFGLGATLLEIVLYSIAYAAGKRAKIPW